MQEHAVSLVDAAASCCWAAGLTPKPEVVGGALSLLRGIRWGAIPSFDAFRPPLGLLRMVQEAARDGRLAGASDFSADDIYQDVIVPLLESCGALRMLRRNCQPFESALKLPSSNACGNRCTECVFSAPR
jgi:hypothetical protein